MEAIFGLIASYMSCLCQQNCLFQPLATQCQYIQRPRRTFERLRRKMEELSARAADVKTMLDIAKRHPGMEPKAEVVLWLENVLKIQGTMDRMVQEFVEEKRCLNGCFPNYCHRYRSGKCIDGMVEEVIELLEVGKFSDGPLVRLKPERGKELPTTTIVGNSTARRNLERIDESLVNEAFGRIGVYGMGGVGKTTIMTEIHNRLLKEVERFDSVIWVTASKESNPEKLRKDIAKALGVRFSENDDERASPAELLYAFQQKGRFVLIIDDLWQAFSLEDIGIPSPTRENGCKLVITTRLLGVCQGMETDREIEMELLSEEEAWDLFKEKVCEDVFLSTEIEAVARDVAKECGGLPLAIITVGRALRKVDDLMEWQNALSELRDSTATASIEGMENMVFARLRFSYERLRDNVTRSCFLFCALYPEDHHIETKELIKYWIWEGLLGDVGKIQANMRKGKVILNELKNACMLESVGREGSNYGYVKMHGLIRDMAIDLTRVSPRCIIQAGLGMEIPPFENEWVAELERVSLMRNDLKYLISEPRCPNLCTLLLQYNSLKDICGSFFDNMPNLKVLDLSYTGINCLPESLSNLENLRALLLCSCWNLTEVPTLAKLTELRALDLSYTPIRKLPEGMEMLVKLRHLDLSYTGIKEFPTSLLPTYKLLENLLMVCRPQGSTSGYDRSTYVEELINSTNLEYLKPTSAAQKTWIIMSDLDTGHN